MRKFLGMTAAVAILAGSAFAADARFGMVPEACEDNAEIYVLDRLDNTRGARIEVAGEPYPVLADFPEQAGVPCWAIDVVVKSRLETGSWSGNMRYTVIFHDGAPVALDADGVRLTTDI